MAGIGRDFWSHQLDYESVVPPLVLLKEQASNLAERTKGIVIGRVETTEETREKGEEYLDETILPEVAKRFRHTLYLVAPALNDYRYALLSVVHDFVPYPCLARFHPLQPEARIGMFKETIGGPILSEMSLSSEDTFLEWLAAALRRRETTRVVLAIVHRVRELKSEA